MRVLKELRENQDLWECRVILCDNKASNSVLIGPQGPVGPPGDPGRDAICPKCPVAENFITQAPFECPRVEQMECPKTISSDGEGSPKGVDRLVPFIVENVSSSSI